MLEERERIRDPEKTQLVFSGAALEALQEIARREDKRLDQVVEEALSLKKWTLDVKDEGGEVIIRRGRKDVNRLVL